MREDEENGTVPTLMHSESSLGWGGQENRTLEELRGLSKKGYRTLLLCPPEAEIGKRAAAEGIAVRHCRMGKSYDVAAVASIRRIIREEGVDILNTHSGRDSLLAGLAGRMSPRRPIIVRTRHLALPITSRISYRYLPHRVVTVSEYVRRYLVGEGVPVERIVAIPTGVDIRRFSPGAAAGTIREELGLSPAVPLVGMVAILRRKKGHHILLDAVPEILRAVPETVFVLAGNGPQWDNVSGMIRNRGLVEKVFMLGLRQDVPNVIASLDLFVLPTLEEALGTSFLEAMAMEKPVVGTLTGGVPEVVEDGVNGYLVPPGDAGELARAVIAVLRDREGARRMGIEGYRIVRENYTVERMCAKMDDLYTALAGERRR
ncbi:MAG TPA: glycosyltransferase family 4 protein [Candidatus Deferrimicrobiaceae bacterium]|nr:glycosyltransferase family 4 protein [Candidatus Deferrimicrobiaceae bacterium]